MITNKCSKCGASNLESNIVFHHLSYDTDNVILLCKSCHQKIHIEVRDKNECPLPVGDVRILTTEYSHIRNTGIKGRVFKKLVETNVYVYTMIRYNPETDKLRFKFIHTGQHKENKAENQKRYRSKEEYKTIRSGCNKRYRNSEKGMEKQREADMRYKKKMKHRNKLDLSDQSSLFDF